MVQIDMAGLGVTQVYKLLIGSIVPRPIALTSTIDSNGITNLAPFSFFSGVSSDPPCVMLAITRKPDGGKKDTLRNIEANREFVVNTVAHWMAGPMNQCSAEYPPGESEFEKVGLTPLPSVKVRPPRVKESPIHMECELFKMVEIGDGRVGSSVIVVGRILMMHVHAAAYENGKIKLDAIDPVSRLSGISYGRTSGVYEIPRARTDQRGDFGV